MNEEKIKELREERDRLYKEAKNISNQIEELIYNNLSLEKIKYGEYCSFKIPDQGEFIGIIEDKYMMQSSVMKGDMSLLGKFIKKPDDNFVEYEDSHLLVYKKDIPVFLDSLSYKSTIEFKCLLDLYIEKSSNYLYQKFNIQ